MKNAPYSFLQFRSAMYSYEYLLGLLSTDAVRMQFFSDAKRLEVDLLNNAGQLVAEDSGVLERSGELVRATLTLEGAVAGNCYFYRIAVYRDAFCAIEDICLIEDICAVEAGEVFEYYYSQKFKVLYDDAHTALIRYYNNEGFAGFQYVDALLAINEMRVPVELKYPQSVDEIEVYRTSLGERKLISVKADKEYDVLIGFADEHFHFCLRNALLHDYVAFKLPDKLFERYSNEERYEIEWTKKIGGITLARANTKVKLASYDIGNPNFLADDLDLGYGFSLGFSEGFNG